MTTLQMPYSPRRAWALAGVYLLLLLVLSGLAGTPGWLLATPPLKATQLGDALWWLLLLSAPACSCQQCLQLLITVSIRHLLQHSTHQQQQHT
jgi:hypothetical protein